MAAVAFDTLKFVRALREKAKLSPEQAEGFAEAITEAVQTDIATKADLTELELRLSAEIEATKLRLEAGIQAAKSDIIKWIFGTIGFQTLLVLGSLITILRMIKP